MEIALLVWAFALTVLVIIGVVWVLDLQAQLRLLRQGYEKKLAVASSDPAGLAALLEDLSTRLEDTRARTERLATWGKQVDATLARSVQGVGLVRFRAFEDTGGDQSFALALADAEGNGVVLSALYGRDATRVYAKPIQGWVSSRPLTAEEERALAQAREDIVNRVSRR